MPLQQQIDAAIGEFTDAIKSAEENKKQLVKQGAEILKANADFSSEVKRVVSALKDAQDALDGWEQGYENWISTLKSYASDFATYKKKSVAVEKFYAGLQDEKTERDKARKKAGAAAKPTKEDELLDAVFKRAKAAYDNDPGRTIEVTLKDIRNTWKDLDSDYKGLVMNLQKAMAEYDKMSGLLRSFSGSLHFNEKPGKPKLSPIGAEFDRYFKVFN